MLKIGGNGIGSKISSLKKILIITPHYPPSNLAAVHRSRLFAQHLPSFNWQPVILTVDDKHYEENLDWNLWNLLPQGQRIEKVKAFPVTKPRIIGDIGLRAFFQLRKKAVELITNEKIDFIYIPVPSFYSALLGRYLKRKTGVNYGIDYIDPWVHQFPGAEKILSRHWWSMKLANILEPIAVKKASLITGVAEGYYRGVQERNPRLARSCIFGAMPYGGEVTDHDKIKSLGVSPYLFQREPGKFQLVYAGALLPKAFQPLEEMLQAMQEHSELITGIEFHFIGTGKSPNDPHGFTIKPLAEKYGVWQSGVFEYPARIPYLDVLVHLQAASGILILGSTEPHYTPSKVYQAILSSKPILALLHAQSQAFGLVNETGAGITVPVNEANLKERFIHSLKAFLAFQKSFSPEKVDRQLFQQFSAREVTRKLADLLNKTQK